jgi:choline dehydrogenase-like flavoprotein
VGDPANPPRSPRSTPPVAFGVFGETMARGFNKLGWYWWPADNAIISGNYDARPGCQLHGKCLFGCAINAKATPGATYWPKALNKGAVLKTWARVREVAVDAQGRARGALYYDRQGHLHQQLAKVVVVCCNGVGTPRLLLNSKSKLFPQGLANSSGMVGRNFMLHPFRYLEGIFDQEMHAEQGIPIPALSQQFYETDLSRGFVRGYSLFAHGGFGPLHNAWGGSVGKPVAWGAEHHRSMRKRFPYVVRLAFLGEDLPNENNRVELDPDAKDSNGITSPRVIYKHDENSLKMLEHGAKMGHQAFEAAGAVEINVGSHARDANHLMGTARMGSDPKRSVVNAWLQTHDVKNLFVVDGSSFTTSAAVNPTSTIGALALRAADGIWQRRREWS